MSVTALVERLSEECALPVLGPEGLADFARDNEFWALCFFTDPKLFPENFDLAVVLPQILKGFPGLAAAIVAPPATAALARDYGVSAFPAVVLMRHGQIKEVLARIQSWGEYRECVQRLLNTVE